MQPIVLLISIVFPGRPWLIWLCRSRWRRRDLAGDISSYLTRKSAIDAPRTLNTFVWRSKESLGALWLQNNAAEAQKYLFKWSPPAGRQAPWWQTGGASRIYCGHGAGSRTRLWTVPLFLSKSSDGPKVVRGIWRERRGQTGRNLDARRECHGFILLRSIWREKWGHLTV